MPPAATSQHTASCAESHQHTSSTGAVHILGQGLWQTQASEAFKLADLQPDGFQGAQLFVTHWLLPASVASTYPALISSVIMQRFCFWFGLFGLILLPILINDSFKRHAGFFSPCDPRQMVQSWVFCLDLPHSCRRGLFSGACNWF